MDKSTKQKSIIFGASLLFFLEIWGYSLYGNLNPRTWDSDKLLQQKRAQQESQKEYTSLEKELMNVADIDGDGFDILDKLKAWKRMGYSCLGEDPMNPFIEQIYFPKPTIEQLKIIIESYKTQ